MSLPRKKSRKIHVNGEDFRYIISKSKTDEDSLFMINITVQNEAGNGSKLLVSGITTRDYWLDFPHVDNDKKTENYPIITSVKIASIITDSIKKGWLYDRPGKEYKIEIKT